MPDLSKHLAAIVLASFGCALAAGCDRSAGSTPEGVASQPPAAASQPAGEGVIRGKVMFNGPKPVLQQIDVAGFPACRSHAAPKEEYAVVNPNGTLKNVLVYLQDAPRVAGAGLPAVMLDQVHCRYEPHVVAVRTGQALTIRSSDDTIHNVHGEPAANPAFNFGQTGAGQRSSIRFTSPEIFRIRCDVHPWMNAYVGVFENPWFAQTGGDGSYEIRNVPPGEYTLIAWQEHYDVQQRKVSVSDDKPVAADFTYGPG